MEYKKAKAYLDGIRSCRLNLVKYELSIARIRYELEHPLTGISYEADKVGGSPKGDALEKKVIKYLELLGKHEELYVAKQMELETLISEAEQKIIALPDGREKDYLYAVYIEGVPELDFGIEVGHTVIQSTYNLQCRAIKLFAKNY